MNSHRTACRLAAMRPWAPALAFGTEARLLRATQRFQGLRLLFLQLDSTIAIGPVGGSKFGGPLRFSGRNVKTIDACEFSGCATLQATIHVSSHMDLRISLKAMFIFKL